jgi:hypothetical protein
VSGEFPHEGLADFGSWVASARESGPKFTYGDPPTLTTNWRDRIVPADQLDFNNLDDRWVINEHIVPRFPGPPVRRHGVVRRGVSKARRVVRRSIGR